MRSNKETKLYFHIPNIPLSFRSLARALHSMPPARPLRLKLGGKPCSEPLTNPSHVLTAQVIGLLNVIFMACQSSPHPHKPGQCKHTSSLCRNKPSTKSWMTCSFYLELPWSPSNLRVMLVASRKFDENCLCCSHGQLYCSNGN